MEETLKSIESFNHAVKYHLSNASEGDLDKIKLLLEHAKILYENIRFPLIKENIIRKEPFFPDSVMELKENIDRLEETIKKLESDNKKSI